MHLDDGCCCVSVYAGRVHQHLQQNTMVLAEKRAKGTVAIAIKRYVSDELCRKLLKIPAKIKIAIRPEKYNSEVHAEIKQPVTEYSKDNSVELFLANIKRL